MKTAIVGSFVFLGVYALAVLIGWYATALFLFSVSPLVVIYVVYKVLRDPQEVTQTFDQHFYQDHPYQRNQG